MGSNQCWTKWKYFFWCLESLFLWFYVLHAIDSPPVCSQSLFQNEFYRCCYQTGIPQFMFVYLSPISQIYYLSCLYLSVLFFPPDHVSNLFQISLVFQSTWKSYVIWEAFFIKILNSAECEIEKKMHLIKYLTLFLWEISDENLLRMTFMPAIYSL